MTDNNILQQIKLPKGDLFYDLKGDPRFNDDKHSDRIAAGLDAMLGKRADIASRVVAS
jgi:hypothetical protein